MSGIKKREQNIFSVMSFEQLLEKCGHDWDVMRELMDKFEKEVGALSRYTENEIGDTKEVLQMNLELEREFRKANMDVLWDLHRRLLKCDHRFARFSSHIWREPLFETEQTWEPGTSCDVNAYHLGRIGGRAVDPNLGERLLGLKSSPCDADEDQA